MPIHILPTGMPQPSPSMNTMVTGSSIASNPSQSGTSTTEIPTPGTETVAGNQITSPSTSQVQAAIDKVNSALEKSNVNLEFSVDSTTKQPLIKVVDSSSGETIKQIPSQAMIAISQEIDQFQQKGLLIQQKV